MIYKHFLQLYKAFKLV